MYSFIITTQLLENIKKITELKTHLNLLKCSQKQVVKLEFEARADSVFSSTSVEGNPLSLTVVKQVMKSNSKNLITSEKEVKNYNYKNS